MSLDADSIGYLDDVKKGKPRRFVMICKGVRIMSMVVYKKGTVERYKKQAKEEGKGQFYHGVIEGKGLEITFKMCRADGYEKPPGKEIILKDFLSTETGIRFKPSYELVDVLPEVSEHDEVESSEAEHEEQKTVPQAPPMPEGGTYSTTDLAAECKRLKTTLYPQVKLAVASHPDQKDAIIRLLASADKNEKASEFASAIEDYRKLSAVLSSLPEDEEKEEESESTENPAVTFNERLKALLADLKVAAGTPAGDEAKRIINEAGACAKQKDFVRGNALLEKAHEILNDWAAESQSTTGDPAVLFNERLKAFLPEVKAAAGTLAGDEAKRLVGEAGACAKKKDFTEANSLLDEAAAILEMHGGDEAKTDVDSADHGNGQPFSIVNAQASRLAWDGARKKMQSELQNLEATILKAVEEHNQDEEAEDEYEMSPVADGAKKLYTILDTLDTRLLDKLDDALNSEGEAREARHKEAKQIIKEYQQFVANDPLMAIVDSNPFVDSTIRQTIDRTLAVLASKI
jgi:hypothetical protein